LSVAFDFHHSHFFFLTIKHTVCIGKTVQAVAACILRNFISFAKKEPAKPTLICSPNDAVLKQWHETLIKAGVDKGKIYRFKTKASQPLMGEIFILCNRYDFQTDAQHVFAQLKRQQYGSIRRSPLFPNASESLLRVLKNQYDYSKGRAKNKYKADKHTNICAVITDYLATELMKNHKTVFHTVVLDESVGTEPDLLLLFVRSQSSPVCNLFYFPNSNSSRT